MMVTREQQLKLVNDYQKDHTANETDAFIEGMESALELIDQNLKSLNK